MNTHDYLNSLTLQQLMCARDRADAMVKAKQAEKRRVVWCVESDRLTLHFYPSERYVEAAERLLEEAKKRESAKKQIDAQHKASMIASVSSDSPFNKRFEKHQKDIDDIMKEHSDEMRERHDKFIEEFDKVMRPHEKKDINNKKWPILLVSMILRGGQIFMHSLRMFGQATKYLIKVISLLFIILLIWFTTLKTNPYDRYLFYKFADAEINLLISGKHARIDINNFQSKNTHSKPEKMYAKSFVNHPRTQLAIKHCIRGFGMGLYFTLPAVWPFCFHLYTFLNLKAVHSVKQLN